jgi:hypothetical protein
MIGIWKDIRGRRIDLRAFLIGTLPVAAVVEKAHGITVGSRVLDAGPGARWQVRLGQHPKPVTKAAELPHYGTRRLKSIKARRTGPMQQLVVYGVV